ncbi:hypothetical protein OC846_002281 [Tilletia horrida]|uniref:WW domain-containing protein n=1 Tax=Tilletia horrida TaxID=155126 RepID=A0AAN6JZ25_9BASI|nr:hypothetical protein OC846_002281 [Tilletia horrida]
MAVDIFYDNKKRTTTRFDPRRLRALGLDPRNLHVQQGNSERVPLPPGWEMRLSDTNKIYFVDHNSKTTSWSDPRRLHFLGPNGQTLRPHCVRQLGPLSSGWEEQPPDDDRVPEIKQEADVDDK